MTRKLQQWVFGALLAVCLVPGAALAQYGEYYWTWDNFSNGFSVGAPGSGSKWFHFGTGPDFTGDDGQTSPFHGGMYVWSPTSHPTTGLPTFIKTVKPEHISGLPGGLDHVKWLVYMNHFSSYGYPGFDAQWNHELSCSTSMNGATYGTEHHPFGGYVANHQSDVRLATYAMNTIDFQSYMVFDFMFTNEMVYAIYERLPFGRTASNNYAAFTYAIPVKARSAWTNHNLSISYDQRGGVVRWIIDGVEVFSVSSIGYRLPQTEWMIIDHGGTEQWVTMNQLACGMGMFTMLDGVSDGGWGGGLVRLSSVPNFYYVPYMSSWEQWFFDYNSSDSSRIFGQGAFFQVGTYSVQSTQIYMELPPPYECPDPYEQYPHRYPRYEFCMPY
jgi:hypothetical protein